MKKTIGTKKEKLELKFCWSAFFTIHSFNQLTDYFEVVSAATKSIEKEYSDRIKADLEKIDDYETFEIESQGQFTQHENRFEVNFPMQQSFSFIILLYSLIESNLKTFSRFLSKEKISLVTVMDFEGDISEKLIKYKLLNNILDVEESDLNRIKELSKIRNCLVHSFGKIQKEEASLIRYCKANKYIHINRNNHIKKIDIQWCFGQSKKFKIMFESMYTSIGYTNIFDLELEKLKKRLSGKNKIG